MNRLCLLVLAVLTLSPAPAQQRHSDTVDDLLQYTPYLSVFALKACGVESRSDWVALTGTAAASWLVSGATAYSLKHTVREWRPDHSDRRSFPSGHATFAFAGAMMLHKEYGGVSPWISVVGFSVATLTAADRVARDRHHWYDVTAGAVIGIASTELTCYLRDKLFKDRKVAFAVVGPRVDVALNF